MIGDQPVHFDIGLRMPQFQPVYPNSINHGPKFGRSRSAGPDAEMPLMAPREEPAGMMLPMPYHGLPEAGPPRPLGL